MACSHSGKWNHPDPYKPAVVMHGDTSFTKGERASIEKAAGIWKYQTDGLANLKVVWDLDSAKADIENENVILRMNSSDEVVQWADCEATGFGAFLAPGQCEPIVLAWVSPSGGVHNNGHRKVQLVIIPDRYNTPDLELAVELHEMGHIFGLPHLPSPQSVMYPSANAEKTCLRQADLSEFCSQNVCTGYTMHPCEE